MAHLTRNFKYSVKFPILGYLRPHWFGQYHTCRLCLTGVSAIALTSSYSATMANVDNCNTCATEYHTFYQQTSVQTSKSVIKSSKNNAILRVRIFIAIKIGTPQIWCMSYNDFMFNYHVSLIIFFLRERLAAEHTPEFLRHSALVSQMPH